MKEKEITFVIMEVKLELLSRLLDLTYKLF